MYDGGPALLDIREWDAHFYKKTQDENKRKHKYKRISSGEKNENKRKHKHKHISLGKRKMKYFFKENKRWNQT